MNREDLFACLEKAGEAFEKQKPAAVAEPEEELDPETLMQEEELAKLVAQQMGLSWEAANE